MEIRVLSYNIHKGFRMGNLQFVLHGIRDLLRSIDVDIVFLQEVIGHSDKHASKISKWPTQTQYEFLADEVWSSYSYGKNAVHPRGHYGNALLSRFPISTSENVNISTNRLEKRGLLHTKIELPGTSTILHACCTHLDLTERGRVKQVKKLSDWISAHVPQTEPLILAGDFNDYANRASSELRRNLKLTETVFESKGKLQATFPAIAPLLSLDRIYQRDFKVVEARVLKEKAWRKLSDHLPVYAALSIEGRKEGKGTFTTEHTEVTEAGEDSRVKK